MEEEINTFIKPSKIHGLGIFADREILAGEEIVQAMNIDFTKGLNEWIKYNKLTKKKSMALVRGYCLVNHSENPNTYRGEESKIIASRNIKHGEEITEDYNKLPDNENPFKNIFEQLIFETIH